MSLTFTQLPPAAFGTMGVPGEVAAPPALARTMEVVRTVTKRTCSIDGCDKEDAAPRGWCWGHYQRWRRHGDPLGGLSWDDKFWAQVDRSGGPDACWPWTGRIDRKGYALCGFRGKTRSVHRVAWFLTYGDWPKLTLDHMCHDPKVCTPGPTCPHRRCANPSHAEDVPGRQNTRRGGGPSGLNAAKTECKHGHPLSGDNLRIRARGRICLTCELDRKHRYRARERAGRQVPTVAVYAEDATADPVSFARETLELVKVETPEAAELRAWLAENG